MLVSIKKELYLKHLLKLSIDDRYYRFFQFMSDESIKTYVSNVIEDDIIMSSCGYGFSHIPIFDDIMEIGISVDASHRGIGIGRTLILDSIAHAKKLKCKEIHMICMGTNKTMVEIAEKNGAIISRPGYEVAAKILI